MEDEHITIGIEGLVGSGKTSLCRELLNMIPSSALLHGGNLYRGIVVAVMNSNIDLKEKIEDKNEKIDIKKLMDLLKVEVKMENRESVVYVNNIKIDEDKLQSTEASIAVSKVAKDADNSRLYSFARKLIDNYKQSYNLIISGRDLMQIYPKLDYHFFITADLAERVNRKYNQYSEKNKTMDIEKLKSHIQKRDELQEQSGFYRKYANTIEIDVTDCKSAKESAEKVFKQIKLSDKV